MFLFSIVFLPFVCLNLWYNYYRFGSVFETGYSLIAMKTGLDFFSGTPLLTGLSGLLISPGKGLFLLFSGCHSLPVLLQIIYEEASCIGFRVSPDNRILYLISLKKYLLARRLGMGGPVICLS